MHIESIAGVCHEANASFCRESGDDSQPRWGDAPDWQRTSAVNGVRFHLDTPDALPSHSHESWLAEKVENGWIYGESKDVDTKTHPCMVPFGELPIEQQAKDVLFKSVVDALRPLATES